MQLFDYVTDLAVITLNSIKILFVRSRCLIDKCFRRRFGRCCSERAKTLHFAGTGVGKSAVNDKAKFVSQADVKKSEDCEGAVSPLLPGYENVELSGTYIEPVYFKESDRPSRWFYVQVWDRNLCIDEAVYAGG